MSIQPKRSLAILGLLAACMVYYYFGVLIPHVRVVQRLERRDGGYSCGNDLYPIWLTTGELLAHRTNPYTLEMEHRIESGLYGRPLDRSNSIDGVVNYRGFSYPLYTDVLAIPLALASFRTVQIVLLIAFPILIVLGVRWWAIASGVTFTRIELVGATLLTLFSVQVLEGIWALQPTMIVGVLLGFAMSAMRRNHLLVAGIVIALCSIKPQLIALLTLWLLLWACSDWMRRRLLLFALVVSGLGLLVLGEIWLPRWWIGWWHQLPNYRLYDSPALAELVLGKVIGRLLGMGVLALCTLAAFRWRRTPADSIQFSLMTAFLLVCSVVFISSSIAVYDQFLLLPAALQVWIHRDTMRQNRTDRFVAFLLMIAFLWTWIAAAAVGLLHRAAPLLVSPRIVILPLVTAASFPLLMLALLCILVLRCLRETTSGTKVTLMRQPAIG